MRALLAIALACFALACGQKAPAPEEPVWGKQACAHCLMLLSDRRAAAQLVREDGTYAFFDDVGCMVEWLARENEPVRARWVRKPDGSGWIAAEQARYSTGHQTPMDYGLLPDDTGAITYEAARTLVQEAGRARRERAP